MIIKGYISSINITDRLITLNNGTKFTSNLTSIDLNLRDEVTLTLTRSDEGLLKCVDASYDKGIFIFKLEAETIDHFYVEAYVSSNNDISLGNNFSINIEKTVEE